MRKGNDYKLSEVIKEMIDSYHLTEKLDETNIKEKWEKLCGKVIARHTKRIYINKKNLFVQVDSAALRSELSMAKARLLSTLNKEIGEGIIDDIIFQ
jgi:predicted nucleic acid-binding Zn ribbon protein